MPADPQRRPSKDLQAVYGSVPDDLSRLPSLEEDRVRDALKQRFEAEQIYTHINALLVAMNPYKMLPIYDQKALEAYNQYGVASPGPHVFGVAASTYRGLLDARSQSVIISGESGAGKTETAKRFLQFLAYAATQGSGSSNEGLEERVIATSPLLEAFGNAQTVMNHNSSRYGKYLMLQFDLSGKIMGASIRTYLLEKTRVVRQSKGERNYHIFYLLTLGAPADQRAQLQVNSSFNYLSTENDHRGTDPTEAFNEVVGAMRSIGFDQNELKWVWTLCATIMKLGNIGFGSGEEASVADPQVVREIATKLKCDAEGLTNALSTRRIKAGSDWIVSPVSPAVAEAVRDGMAKAMYQRVFNWMVMRINANLAILQIEDGLSKARFFIGILDIFGFEMFDTNSLEQLCINFTNEKLQATFNQAIFHAAM
jgi:myosin heavy subunit